MTQGVVDLSTAFKSALSQSICSLTFPLGPDICLPVPPLDQFRCSEPDSRNGIKETYNFVWTVDSLSKIRLKVENNVMNHPIVLSSNSLHMDRTWSSHKNTRNSAMDQEIRAYSNDPYDQYPDIETKHSRISSKVGLTGPRFSLYPMPSERTLNPHADLGSVRDIVLLISHTSVVAVLPSDACLLRCWRRLTDSWFPTATI